MNIRTVFMGNHDVGVRVLEAISEKANVVGVVAHPEDPEDGVRYSSVFDYSIKKGILVVRGKPSDQVVVDFISMLEPDLLWVTDYRYILPAHITANIKYCINLHPSLLPKYRGRASINWAILNNESEIGLTAHFIDERADTGDVIKQYKTVINKNEDVNDALNKLYPLYKSITFDVLGLIESGKIVGRRQNDSLSSYFGARKPSDGEINWSKDSLDIHNLIRAVAPPYPGAFSKSTHGLLEVFKAKRGSYFYRSSIPGTIFNIDKNGNLYVTCGRGFLILTDWHADFDGLHIGMQV